MTRVQNTLLVLSVYGTLLLAVGCEREDSSLPRDADPPPSWMTESPDHQKAATIQIKIFQNLLDVFHEDLLRFPETEEGLNALLANPTDDPRWKGPYSPLDRIPLDPWGNAYEYESLHLNRYRLWSRGPDGVSGTPDDIAVDGAGRGDSDQVDIVILLDVSRSMLAEDVAPNRIERAKMDVVDLLPAISGHHVGLVVFGDKAAVKAPLSKDHEFVRSQLDEITADQTGLGHCRIGNGIRKCLDVLPTGSNRHQAIVLVTAGWDQDSSPLEAARQARKRGVRILGVALGDFDEGARIPVENASGQAEYLKDDHGHEVWTRPDGPLMKDIALTTEGAYVPAGTSAYHLGQIYADVQDD